MASSIAASTSGGGGLISTADASGNLNLVSGTTTIVALTSAGIAVTGTLTATGTTTLVTPVLGTPASGNLANCTGAVVASLSTASGSAPSYSARAWVNFNGTGTVAITGSANVSSITDGGTGIYTVNFTTAMADANYATVTGGIALDATNNSRGAPLLRFGGTYSTTAVAIQTGASDANTLYDTSSIHVTIFR